MESQEPSNHDHSSWMNGLDEDQSTRLTQVLDEYLESLEKGDPLETESLFAANPDIAPNLRLYLEQIQNLYGAAASIRRDPLSGPAVDEEGIEQRKKLGDFTLVREIGRGGMGIVYEAIQESLGRRVALKVLPFTAMFSPNQVARFRNEAQAAAQLQHPNIIPVYAIGAEKGIHFFAMPMIEGQSLDAVISELKSNHLGSSISKVYRLNNNASGRSWIQSILPMSIQAAQALHAAHEVGIIHRDIKPSNLILDSSGKIWVADFGLARSTMDKSLTRTGELVGTIRYMSPEQAAGQSALVDQRTDIYSLGVTLYELLVLQPAIAGEDGPSLLRAIEQQEPTRLRRLRPDIPKDLETVIEKAISKHRDDRYVTAEDFANDLKRVLDGRPTKARPPGIASRLTRWGARHRKWVAAATVVVLLATVGLAISTILIAIQKSEVLRFARSAEESAHDAQRVVDLMSEYSEDLSGIPGTESIRRGMLSESLGYYRKLAEKNQNSPRMELDVARSFNRTGTLVRELESPKEAIPHFQEAARRFSLLRKADASNRMFTQEWASNQTALGLALGETGDRKGSQLAFADAIEAQRTLLNNSEPQSQYDLAKSLNNSAMIAAQGNDRKLAEVRYEEAKRLLETLWNQETSIQYRSLLPIVLNNLAAIHDHQDMNKAVALYRESLAYQKELEGQSTQTSRLALTLSNLGSVLGRQHKWAEAREAFLNSIEILRRASDASPDVRSYRRELATSINNLALMESESGDPEAANRWIEEAISIQQKLLEDSKSDLDSLSGLGVSYNNMAKIQQRSGNPSQAAKSYLMAIDYQKQALAGAPSVPRFREYLSRQMYNFSKLQEEQKQWNEALEMHLQRIPLWQGNPQKLLVLATELAELATAADLQGGGSKEVRKCVEAATEALRGAKSAGLSIAPDIIKNEPLSILLKYRSLDELVRP